MEVDPKSHGAGGPASSRCPGPFSPGWPGAPAWAPSPSRLLSQVGGAWPAEDLSALFSDGDSPVRPSVAVLRCRTFGNTSRKVSHSMVYDEKRPWHQSHTEVDCLSNAPRTLVRYVLFTFYDMLNCLRVFLDVFARGLYRGRAALNSGRRSHPLYATGPRRPADTATPRALLSRVQDSPTLQIATGRESSGCYSMLHFRYHKGGPDCDGNHSLTGHHISINDESMSMVATNC